MRTSNAQWPEVQLGKILTYVDERVALDDMTEYITITVKRRHGGLEAREKLFGHQIKTKKQFKLTPNSFIISRVQCWHQAYALVPETIPSNMIASTNYDQFTVNPEVDRRFFWWLSHSPRVTETVRDGALHLYLEEGELRKHSWSRTGRRLTDSIREGLDQGQFPLFVAEGSPDKKLQQIQRSGYLWYCLEKLRSIQSPLVIFGHSLGSSDGHILDAIASNIELSELYIGLHGDPESVSNQSIKAAAQQMVVRRTRHSERRKYHPLEVHFYSSDSVQVWG
jgi:hypothetical protein